MHREALAGPSKGLEALGGHTGTQTGLRGAGRAGRV